MQKGEKWLWIITLLLFVAIAIIAGYKYRYSQQKLPVIKAPLRTSCDLHKTACSVAVAKVGTVTLNITPHPIAVVTPLQITVQADIKGIRHVAVDFRGVDMDMGFNRFELKGTKAGTFEGEGMLPVCVRSRMTWEARVLIQQADDIISVPYRFDTTGHLQ